MQVLTGFAPLAGRGDQGGHESVVAVAVDRRGQPQHRRADADAPQGQHQQGGGRASTGGVGPDLGAGDEAVPLGGEPAGGQPEEA